MTSVTTPIILKNERGIEVHVLPIGAVIQRLFVPDRRGILRDVVLGFEHKDPYEDGTSPYFGAVVGRVANRIANGSYRSADGAGRATVALSKNDGGKHTLHGGEMGFSRKQWTVEAVGTKQESGNPFVSLALVSPDLDQGFRGEVRSTVTYELSKTSTTLHISMESTARGHPTPVSLSQHTYFNLAGHDSEISILEHELRMKQATYWTPVDEDRIPTGDFLPVKGTPMDFATAARTIGDRIDDVPGGSPGGYDHNFVLFDLGPEAKSRVRSDGMVSALSGPELAAELKDGGSGRGLRIYTNAPGLQLYSGNFLDGSLDGTKGGVTYNKHAGMCLETQCFPNAVNRRNFPSCVLEPGPTQHHEDIWEFFTF